MLWTAPPNGDGLLLRSTGITHPLHHYYEAARPNRRIGTFGLAVGAARAFFLGIAV